MTEIVPETARLTADVVLFGERDGQIHALVIRRALSAEGSALLDTKPPAMLACDCNGTGFVLTGNGRALVEFLGRHGVGSWR